MGEKKTNVFLEFEVENDVKLTSFECFVGLIDLDEIGSNQCVSDFIYFNGVPKLDYIKILLSR